MSNEEATCELGQYPACGRQMFSAEAKETECGVVTVGKDVVDIGTAVRVDIGMHAGFILLLVQKFGERCRWQKRLLFKHHHVFSSRYVIVPVFCRNRPVAPKKNTY